MKQLAHCRLYDTKAYNNSYKRRYNYYTQKGSQIHQYIMRKRRGVVWYNKMQIWPKRPTNKHNPSQLVPRSQAATWEPRTIRRRPRRNHLVARCRPPLKYKYKGVTAQIWYPKIWAKFSLLLCIASWHAYLNC